MMRRLTALLLILAAACSSDVTSPVAVHGVSLMATLGGRGPSGDTVNVRITNSGTANAYLAPCGGAPLLFMQQFVGDKWTDPIQYFVCPAVLSGPVVLAPGHSINSVLVFDKAGRFRFLVSVATSDGSDSQQAISNSVDVR